MANDDDNQAWVPWVLQRTGARSIQTVTRLQDLWGGYGQLLRLRLDGPITSAILKWVTPPPLAVDTISDQRKRRSYEVEQNWYLQGSLACDTDCRVARCLGVERQQESSLLLLEDLQLAGFHPTRPPGSQHLQAALRWLAHFHSNFLGQRLSGLWAQGGYWHLQTRTEEWQRMPSGPLKEAAPRFDELLRGARYQTLLHGDAKPSNFCFHPNASAAAVDFQYIGPGCGIRDVAYLLDCFLDDIGCLIQAESCLDVYFQTLRLAMADDGHQTAIDPLEAEWRALFPVAWCDFQRFYQGWSRRPVGLGPFTLAQYRQAEAMLKDQ